MPMVIGNFSFEARDLPKTRQALAVDNWLTRQHAGRRRDADLVERRQARQIFNDRIAESAQQRKRCTLPIACGLPSAISG